jgi:putative membrane protein
MRMLMVSFLVVGGLGVASGCSKGASEAEPGASQGNEAPPTVTGTVPLTKLTDGQIAEILTTVDDGEIEQAQVALKRATDPEVRAFATQMVDQHTASKQAGAQLATQASLKLAPSPKAEELKVASSQALERLSRADANNFDVTYIDGQIEQHATVLKLVQDQLLSAVNEPALRDHLNKTRDLVQQHLDHARQIKK